MLIGEFGIGHVDTHPKTATIIAAGHYYSGKVIVMRFLIHSIVDDFLYSQRYTRSSTLYMMITLP